MKLTLQEYCSRVKATNAADHIGITRGALSTMLKSGREIYVITKGGEFQECYEIRSIPARRYYR